MSRKRCPNCGGTGCWEDDHSGGPCGRCNGEGYLPEPEGAEGEVILPCSRCGKDIPPQHVVVLGADMKPRHWACSDE